MKRLLFIGLCSVGIAMGANAQVADGEQGVDTIPHNPIVQTWFTTDPAPMVHGDRMYVYTGHDEDNADFFWMQEWRVYSTADMVNWQDHGSPAALETFSWADDRAWAPQCIERNGKFYLYVPAHCKTSGTMAIGVAVSDSPTGPFTDPVGKPLADGSWDYIDPTVFIDEDGQAWLYWGNPKVYYAKLNEDMISLVDGVHQMDMSGLPGYVEGPWIQKRDIITPAGKKGKKQKVEKKYYLMYASGGIPEHISYAMSDTPIGPWEYKGDVMPLCDTGSFTNHAGLMDFRGHSYFFYHTGKLPNGGGFGRSVAVEEFKYNNDGTIPTIEMTDKGVDALQTFNPYQLVQAETMSQSSGLKSQPWGTANVYLSDIHNGDWLMLRNVNFGVKVSNVVPTLTVSAASALRGGTVEFRLDSREGEIIASLDIPHTGGWEQFKTFSKEIQVHPIGVHDLFIVFKGRKGPELFTMDWWEIR